MTEKRKTIEIDDAGTGDLVGDAFIGFHLVETGEILFRSIPVCLYTEENLQDNAPKKKIVELVKEGLKDLNYQKGDKIFLCTGDCFDLVREYFEQERIEFTPKKIEGKLQDAVEGRLVAHLRKLGIKSRHLTKESGAKRYFVLFNWICYDFYNREKYVKSGFKKWKTVWRGRALEKHLKLKDQQKCKNIKSTQTSGQSNEEEISKI